MRQKQIQPRLSISLDSPWVLGAPTVLYNTHVMLSVSAICLQQWAGKKKKKNERNQEVRASLGLYITGILLFFGSRWKPLLLVSPL